jgi:hypothetical protein
LGGGGQRSSSIGEGLGGLYGLVVGLGSPVTFVIPQPLASRTRSALARQRASDIAIAAMPGADDSTNNEPCWCPRRQSAGRLCVTLTEERTITALGVMEHLSQALAAMSYDWADGWRRAIRTDAE